MSTLSDAITSLTCLKWIQLVANPIGDDGFQQLLTPLKRLTSLQYLELMDVDLTVHSVDEMEKLLQHTPTKLHVLVVSRKSTFFPTGQVVRNAAQLTSMTWKKTLRFSEPRFVLGYRLTDQLTFGNDRSQQIALQFFD